LREPIGSRFAFLKQHRKAAGGSGRRLLADAQAEPREDKIMSYMKSVLFLMVLAAEVSLASTTITYAVGTCKPSLPSFATISTALAATPAANVVQVCPGKYPEQVVITNPVTLEGITSGNSAQAVIAVPAGGLLTNATTTFGNAAAVQVWVNNATGPVTINNLVVDGTGNNVSGCTPLILGVFYQNSSGTVNKVTTTNQAGNFCGTAIWVEGGSANPSVTVENSDIHDFDSDGIFTGTSALTSELSATIKGNSVTLGSSASFGINTQVGSTGTVTGNLVVGNGGFSEGIVDAGSDGGSISGNTVTNSAFGIIASSDSVPVTSNKIFNSTQQGIEVNTSVAAVTGNTIARAPVGVEFGCLGMNNVHSNTIIDAGVGINDVPSGAVSLNVYASVGTIRIKGLCQ
jgi:hypothetical protein